MSIKALQHHLLPLKPYLQMEGVTEICINQPGGIYVEQFGQFQYQEVKQLEKDFLLALAALVAEYNHQDFPGPLISGALPTGERAQFVLHPACEKESFICSIRKHRMQDMDLVDYEKNGAFDSIKNKLNTTPSKLNELFQQKDIKNFIKQAILEKKNILISGGTGSGKTTFLNACLKCIPTHERIITVEDTREVKVKQPNAVHLLFNNEDETINSLNLFKACLRLRPDRIFLSELRGDEVWPYLRAANSGHPGSLSTIHADTVEGTFTQLVFMMQQAGSTSSEEQIRQYIKSIIHIVVQLKRDPVKFMSVSEIYFNEM